MPSTELKGLEKAQDNPPSKNSKFEVPQDVYRVTERSRWSSRVKFSLKI